MTQSSTLPFAIKSNRVVTPKGEFPAAIIIGAGKIESVVSPDELPSEIPCEDFGDWVISPGIIDAHVHINEPGRTQWEGFATATAAAAAGGITTLIDMPLNSSPVTTDVAALESKRCAAAGKCLVNVEFYGGLVPGNEIEIPGLIAQGVRGIKAFLCDSGLDEFAAVGEKELRAVLPMLKQAGIPLLAHAEIVDPMVAAEHKTSSHWPQQSYPDYMHARPPSFEINAIKLLIDLCREFQAPIHIVHLATAQAIPLIDAAKKEGLPLTVETCPHYLYFCDLDIQDSQTQYKCTPPIRDEGNRAVLRSAVEIGLIDTIGSDHSPCSPELKELLSGDFSKAWGGIASLQLTLPIMATVAKEENWSLEKLVSLLSHRPVEIFGLGETKGCIAAGYDADIVVWDPSAAFIVSGDELEHRHPITPYEDRELSGCVQRTYVGGEVVFENRSTSAESDQNLIDASIADMLNTLPYETILQTLQTCCASVRWCEGLEESRPFLSDEDVLDKSAKVFSALDESDWLEAFEGHPQIGNIETLPAKYANTKAIAGDEQSGVQSASQDVLKRLATANEEYLEKFGFIFIVCATGKSASEILELIQQRLPGTRDQELIAAGEEQSKITARRLKNLTEKY